MRSPSVPSAPVGLVVALALVAAAVAPAQGVRHVVPPRPSHRVVLSADGPATFLEPSAPRPLQGTQNAEGVKEGAKLIEDLGCVACHKVGKHSAGTLGPDLNTVFKRRDEDSLRRKLADPKVDNAASVMPQMNLAEEQQTAIIAYLRSVQK